jgi:flagellar protein FliS
MSAAALRARYVRDSVATAPPARLLVMLYDRLALDLERAEEALARKDRVDANTQLQHAQDIVLELLGSLRVDLWEGGPRLASLYSWLIRELIDANVKQDRAKVAACRRVVQPLHEAWQGAAKVVLSGDA